MLFLFSSIALAGAPIDIHVERQIDASPEAVWAVLGTEFAEIDDWATIVSHSAPVDQADVIGGYPAIEGAPVAARGCNTRLGDFQEVLVAYSDEERMFSFRAEGLPKMMEKSQNTTRVSSAGEGASVVTIDVALEVRGPAKMMKKMLKKKMGKMLDGLLGDLETYVETGEPSLSKKAAQGVS